MATDTHDARASPPPPPPLDPDHLAPSAASSTTTALDLTNEHLPTLEGVELPETLETVDLTANRLKELDDRLLALPNLRKLSLRQNLLADASRIAQSASAPTLEELVFHDNKLTTIPNLSPFTSLRRLELSYNEIKSLGPLSRDATNPGPADALEELYVAANKVSRIEGLEAFGKLRILELGSNRLRVVEGLAHLGSSLRELWLGRNRIEDSPPPPQPLERGSSSPAPSPSSSSLLYKGLAPLTRLERLSLQSNRLASMAQLPPLPSLKELYLSHNGIRRLENLSGFPMLKVLDASSNALEDVSDLARGSGTLTDLWLNDNKIGGGGGGGGGGGEGGKEASGGEGGEAGEAGERKDPSSSSSSTPLQTVDAAVLSHLRASGSSRTVTCMYLARNPVSVDAPAGLMSRRPRPAAAAAAAAGASSSSSVLRNSGVGGSSSSAAAAAAAAFDEEEGLRAERRAARAAFVRELAAALPALAELDGDDLPAGARV